MRYTSFTDPSQTDFETLVLVYARTTWSSKSRVLKPVGDKLIQHGVPRPIPLRGFSSFLVLLLSRKALHVNDPSQTDLELVRLYAFSSVHRRITVHDFVSQRSPSHASGKTLPQRNRTSTALSSRPRSPRRRPLYLPFPALLMTLRIDACSVKRVS
ncbi:hypothetical protein PENSPDRAFT_428324 [Peniophora sp. CONT]|nr:hypothetical protein PENSPDRAFT_428324 [Peniophora sp. CONT]